MYTSKHNRLIPRHIYIHLDSTLLLPVVNSNPRETQLRLANNTHSNPSTYERHPDPGIGGDHFSFCTPLA